MTATNDGLRLASVQAVTGTSYGVNGDWIALFDQAGIAPGCFDGRMTAWINAQLATSYPDAAGACTALALANGVGSFSQLGTFNASSGAVNDIALESGGHITLESGSGNIQAEH